MSNMIQFYRQQMADALSSIPWRAALQKQALTDFLSLGFPTRTHEDWKYTALDSFLQQPFTESATNIKNHGEPTHGLPIKTSICIQDGRIQGLNEIQAHLPKGAIIQPIAEAMVTHADKIKPYLNQVLIHEHGFQALNTALFQLGLFIYLPKQCCLSEPMLISHQQTQANQAMHIRHLIVAEEGSSASIIEHYQGQADICYFTNTLTEIALASNAKLTHVKLQRESKLAYHIGHIAVKQAKSSQFTQHFLGLGGKIARSDLRIDLNEPEAQCLLNGIYMPSEGQHLDQQTVIHHNVPNCKSVQDYKGILSGHARAVFNGKVMVAKQAQQTQAKQQNKNLLLSKHAEIDTKPQLDIYADDVVCTHGATVGQLDEEALFYLATRGIGREEASQYLIQAFAAENLAWIEHQELAAWMKTRLKENIHEYC